MTILRKMLLTHFNILNPFLHAEEIGTRVKAFFLAAAWILTRVLRAFLNPSPIVQWFWLDSSLSSCIDYSRSKTPCSHFISYLFFFNFSIIRKNRRRSSVVMLSSRGSFTGTSKHLLNRDWSHASCCRSLPVSAWLWLSVQELVRNTPVPYVLNHWV